MKVLVTGGAGFIASHVVNGYLDLGHDVAVVDNLSTGQKENLNPAAAFYHMDVADDELDRVFATERPDVVNHHAAQVNVRKSLQAPLHDAKINILGSLNVLECAVRHGVGRVIYSSSGGAVYGEPEELPCSETHAIRPISPYGVSKYTVEQYLRAYANTHDLHWLALRYGNVYGPRQDPLGEAGVVAIFLSSLIAGRRPRIFGDGEQTRDFVYVADCVSANVTALTTDAQGAFNIGAGEGTSVNAIFRRLQQLTGFSEAAIHEAPKKGETRHIYLGIEKARRELGWWPRYGLEEGLAQTAAYFRS